MYNSWNYEPSSKEELVIFYGSDLSLSLSLSRMMECNKIDSIDNKSIEASEFWSEDSLKKDLNRIISQGLFWNNKSTAASTKNIINQDDPLKNKEKTNNSGVIRSIVSEKTANWLIQMKQKNTFYYKCHLIIDGKISKEQPMATYVKCEKLNSRSREWFLNFHCKRLNIKNQNLSWVKNLDDLSYAGILQKLSFDDYMVPIDPEKADIWSQIRIDQFKKKQPISGISKHFEIWSRNNSTGDEFLELAYKVAIEEAENQFITNPK